MGHRSGEGRNGGKRSILALDQSSVALNQSILALHQSIYPRVKLFHLFGVRRDRLGVQFDKLLL
ncbi:MAG: hypothetical protein WBM04_05880 [Candidatus Korobacteraceae bacterium]